MEKQKLIDEFKKIMDEYVIDEVGMTDTCIYADMIPDIVERLVNFLPIHSVVFSEERAEVCSCAIYHGYPYHKVCSLCKKPLWDNKQT